jgi:uncharacterized protein (UPF0303 family)
MDLLDYIISTGSSMEMFTFETHDEAREFGHRLRENIKTENLSDCVDVEINVTTVRVRVTEGACLQA